MKKQNKINNKVNELEIDLHNEKTFQSATMHLNNMQPFSLDLNWKLLLNFTELYEKL